jgi:hypothetical protein
MDWENEIDRIIEKTLKNRLDTSSNAWLMRAIEQKNSHLTIGVANSELLVFDQIDRQLMTVISNSEKN